MKTTVRLFVVMIGALGSLLLTRFSFAQDQLVLGGGDYDGDGCSEAAVFRSSNGLWVIAGLSRLYHGAEADLPASGDYDGNHTTDLAIFRSATGLWHIRGLSRVYHGSSADTALPGDYDGNGTDDFAFFRGNSGLWHLRGLTRVYWGSSADLPAPGDYNGDGRKEIAVFRPSSGLWAVRNLTRLYFGSPGDIPLPSYYQGGGTERVAVFRPSSGLWTIRNFSRFYFGRSGDWAVPGRYTGGAALPGVFRDSNGLWSVRSITHVYLGKKGDLPAAGSAGKVHKVRLGEVRHFAYNIQNVNTTEQWNQLVGTHFDMYVLEPVVTETGEEAFPIADLVREIRDYNILNYHKDPIILTYVDIGQAEDWRWYWQSGWRVGNPQWIVTTDPDGWSGCYPVAYWYPEWENITIYGSGGKSQVEVSLQAGFDGIYMDWIDGFTEEHVVAKAQSDGVDPAVKIFDFIEKIRDYARKESSLANPGYLIVAQNAPDLYQENPSRYLELIDAISCEGIWYDGTGGFDDWDDPTGYNVPTDDIYPNWTEELLTFLAPMKGKLPIFCIEYAQDTGGVTRATEVYTLKAPGEGFVAYCTRRSLSQLSTTPYPAGYSPIDYY